MSRGGRGGRYGSAANKVGGATLPFDIDPTIESDIAAYRAEDDRPMNDKSRHYPALKIPYATPPTEYEKQEITDFRKLEEMWRNSPYYLNNVDVGKIDPSRFNAFEDVTSWSRHQRKKRKKDDGLPELSKLPITWHFLPDELRGPEPKKKQRILANGKTAEDEEDDELDINLSFLTKKSKDPLQRFDENEDENAKDASEDDEVDDGDEKSLNSEDDGVKEIVDDEFDEDEDDAAGDYNAEQFFDNGEEDFDGDEGGGEDAW